MIIPAEINSLKENSFKPIAAVFIQEHNIKSSNTARIHADASRNGLFIFMSPISNYATKGGTAIIIPKDQLGTEQGETIHDAEERVRASLTSRGAGRIALIDTVVEGADVRLIAAYAPSNPMDRTAFFRHTLDHLVNSDTVLGIDANCVPDVSLDVKSTARSAYQNTGANALQDIIIRADLIDIAREWLGNTPFFTCFTKQRGNNLTSTRLDRIYGPNLNGGMWEHVAVPPDMFPRNESTTEIDHLPVEVRITTTTETRGKDLQSIKEAVFDNPVFNEAIAKVITDTITERDPDTNMDWGPTWIAIKAKVTEMSLTQSNTLRFKHTQATKKNIEKRDTLKEKIDGGTATNAHVDEYHTLLQTIRSESHQTKSAMTTFEEIAYDMGKKHDVGSAAFFRPFTPKGAAQWIEAIFIADWTNPSRPVRTGAMATAASSIAAAVTPYYEKLFATKTIDPDAAEECWNTLRTGDRVHPPTADRCSASLTPEEATQTCNRLPTGKAPGPDRIPNKLYKTFSARVGPIIAKVVNESRSKGVFPPGFSSGIITLLYKKKERDDPRNYRPITLLNGDYKIMMRQCVYSPRE